MIGAFLNDSAQVSAFSCLYSPIFGPNYERFSKCSMQLGVNRLAIDHAREPFANSAKILRRKVALFDSKR